MLATLIVLWLGALVSLPPRPSPWMVVLSGLPVVLLASWRAARRAGEPWRGFAARTWDLHAMGLVLLYALGVQMADAHGISTDGVTYFAQLKSVIFDRDLDVAREFEILGQPPRPNHVVPVGPVLVWLPMYLALALVDALGRGLGWWAAPVDPATLGLGLPYIRAALISSFAIGATGLMGLLWYLRREFGPAIALAAIVLTLGATPLYWYMVYEPSMTHAASFGFVALFVVCSAVWVGDSRPSSLPAFAKATAGKPDSRQDSLPDSRHNSLPSSRQDSLPDPRQISIRRCLILGALIGLAFMTRSQESLFALFPALLVLSGAGAPGERVRSALRLAGWAFLGALPWILLQLLHSHVLFTRYEYDLFGQSGYFNPLRSRWMDTLFSSWHGFLSWTPVAYVAVLGTVAYLRRQWQWAAAALVILFLTAWVNGSTQDWAGGWSFGGRRFSSVLVMLAPGLALVIEFAVRRPLVAVTPLIIAALWWNHLLMAQYTAAMLPKDAPVPFARIVRQQAELHTRPPYVYPFAFPANVWFAWREGLPVGKYDVLSSETAGPSIDLVFDRASEKFLLDGWEAPGNDDWGAAWWIGRDPAELAVPLDLPSGTVRITVRSRTRLDEPTMRASLAIEVNGTEVGRFDAGVPEPSTSVIDVPATVAGRAFRRGFNRIAFRSLGVAPVDPTDTRPPGRLSRLRVWPVAIYDLRVEQGK